MGGDDDFVARLEVHTLDDDVAAFAGVACDGDLIGGDAEHLGGFGAEGFADGNIFVAVLEGGVGVEVAEEFGVAVEDGAGGGTDIGGVEVDELIFQGELAADHLPVVFAGGGGRGEAGCEGRPTGGQGEGGLEEGAAGGIHDGIMAERGAKAMAAGGLPR